MPRKDDHDDKKQKQTIPVHTAFLSTTDAINIDSNKSENVFAGPDEHYSNEDKGVSEKSKRQGTLLSFIGDGKPSDPNETSLKDVMDAIANLTLKVDSIGKQNKSLTHLAFDDELTRNSLKGIREAENILELANATELVDFFYDEHSQDAVLRCLPCYNLYLKSRPTLSNLTPFEAQRIINSSGSGTLGTGLFLKKNTTPLLIEGHNKTWYRQKNNCMNHLCLVGDESTRHNKAMELYKREAMQMKKETTAACNIFRAAIIDLKLGAAAKNFESLISFLVCCGVDVGNIGHGRNLFNDILYCLEKTVNGRTRTWLSKPLPSTQLPPHVWATVHKATPSRTTNQAIIVIARNEDGIPCPIPVDALPLFINRCNVFNSLLANGKGFAFLQMLDKSAMRPVSYAAQRFASSSYEQWSKLEKGYSSFWQAFELLHPNRPKEEQWQYMIGGADFVADLLAFLDVMKPIVDLMLRVQSLDAPVWKLKLWWPKVKNKLSKAARGDPDAFPRLKELGGTLSPGDMFSGVELLPGWLITSDSGTVGGERFTREAREYDDAKRDSEKLASDLMNSLEKRVNTVMSDEVYSILEVFDAASLVNLQCGSLGDEGVQFLVDAGEYESLGVDQCRRVLTTISKMHHIQKSGLNFDSRLAHRYMSCIKEAVKVGIWNTICSQWFMLKDDISLNVQDLKLVSFLPVESEEMESHFNMKFEDGREFVVRLHEQNFYRSFYADPEIYTIAKPPSCVILDIILAKGGPEAIVESYYATMRSQQQVGGQLNETLTRRTKLIWCLPSLKLCEAIIRESVKLYVEGDDVVGRYRSNIFTSSRAKEYSVSKVVDRVDSFLGHCPFLADGSG